MNISAKIISYAIYLIFPLLAYAIVKILRNACHWLFLYLCKRTALGGRVEAFLSYLTKKLSNNSLKKLRDKLPKQIARHLHFRISVGGAMMLLAADCFVLAIHMQQTGVGNWHHRLFLGCVPFAAYGLLNRYRAYRYSIISPVMDLGGLALVFLLLVFNCSAQGDVNVWKSMDQNMGVVLQNSLLMVLSWLGCFLLLELYYVAKGTVWTFRWYEKNADLPQKERSQRPVFPRAYMGAQLSLCLFITLVLTLMLGVLIERTGLRFDVGRSVIAWEYFTEPVHILNAYLLLAACGIFFFALGKGTGGLLALLLFGFIYIANFIKLEYHHTFFTWFDLLQIKEMLLIGKEFLTPRIVVLAVAAMVAVVGIIVLFRKHLKPFFKIRVRLSGVLVSLAIFLFFANMVYDNQLQSMNVFRRTWENEDVNVEYNGLIVNLLYNWRTFGEIQMEAPKGYSQEMAKEIKTEFDGIEIPKSDGVKPDVILILAESLFDLDGVEGISLSQDIDATVDAYSAGTLISPRYGGYTSAMEFEALTGLSLAYMPSSLTPYTTYFNNPEEEFPCITREFEKNDYRTLVMHPGLPNFYNRTIVYEEFGFDEYLAIHYFGTNPEDATENGFYKDVLFGERIVEKLEEAEEPTFIFGISYEGHYVTVDKYSNPLIKATSDVIPKERLNQIEQQATSYYYTDQMIANIIEYMDNTERPTLLYVYGDHLPPVEEFADLGFVYDKYGKYSTSLVMYSNYKSIQTDTEYMTPNQLAAQIMVDSGIEHSSYYDYIYSIRKEYPILHKEFVQVEGNPDLDNYYFLQYDILAGKKYLYEKE